jgi:cobaltochelatase CobS
MTGLPHSVVGALTIAKLGELYNDVSGAAILALQEEQGGQPAPTPRPAPAPVPTEQRSIVKPSVGNDKAALMAQLLEAMSAPDTVQVDEAEVRRIATEVAKETIGNIVAPTIKIRIGELPEREISRQHYKFPLLLACVAARVPAYLVGPAGTGKTTAAHKTADCLGLPYGAISVGPMTSKSDLFGMIDANGVYRETELMRRSKNGGVFLFDEFDAGNPATLTAVNMLLANGVFNAPDGMHERHADFIPIFAMNTYGNGADRQYVGRNQLDAATLDRGAFIDWPTDEGLEASFVGIAETSPAFNLSQGDIPSMEKWLRTVRSFRKACEGLKIRHVVSPRAPIMGARLAAAGVGYDHMMEVLLWKGLTPDVRSKIKAKI